MAEGSGGGAAGGRFGVLHVPDFSPGMSSYLRVGTAAGDDYTWRDHTDGNRVTTTRGDKIEVIQGNYQMVVLGRQEHQSGLSAEAGNVGQNSITFRGTVKREGGRVIEETVKGDVHTTYHGDVVDEYHGSLLESRTGSESPGVDRENPDVLEKTWAKRIESYTGSAPTRVPLIKHETWAIEMVSKTNALSMSGETIVEGASRSATKAATLTSETTADAITDTTTVTGNVESTTTAAKQISTTHADSDDTTYGDTTSYHEGNSNVTVKGVETTVNLGMVNESILGMMNDCTIGATLGATVGGSLNVQIGVDVGITLGAHIDVKLAELSLKPSDIKLHLSKLRTALFRKNVAAVNLLA